MSLNQARAKASAKACGLSRKRREIFSNAGSRRSVRSVVSIVGLCFLPGMCASGMISGAFFTGSLLIETLFSLDGLGLLSYESVIRRDYPVVFGSLYVFTIIGLLTTLIRDLSYLWVDPRVKFFD